MKILPLVKAEFARLTSSRMGTIALVALMTVPVVYGGLYLYGNNDPYNNLDRVPAALVVDDTGATVDDEAVNYGQDAADELVDDASFGWVVTTDSEAKAGVTDGTYDFAVTFPASFSHDIASASETSPTQAKLVLTTNDTNSYLSTTIAKQAAATVRTTIAQNVGQEATEQLLSAVDEIRTGLVDASDGATKIADGTSDAASGASDLSDGTSELADGAATLSSGLATLDKKAAKLPASAAALSSGASKIAKGTSAAVSGVKELSTVTGQAAALAPTVEQQVSDVFDAYGVDATTKAGILAELGGLSQATAGIDSAVSDSLLPNLRTLSSGSSELAAGAKTLKKSAPALADAIDSASTGAKKLATGASSAADGAAELSSGIDKLSDGTTELDDSLADAVVEIPATTAADRTATSEAVGDPLDVDQRAITEAGNYGAGLAPFFMGLAAWIGIYALFLLVRPLSRRALTAVRRPIRTTLAGWITPAVLGAVQMVALFLIVTLGLHLDVANQPGLLAFMIFVSITFAAIVLALNALLGSVGQFLGLLLMVVQLVTAGGTFPWQTLPAPLALLHQALPMSHAVDGMRQLIYGGTAEATIAAVIPLALWLVGSLAVAALAAAKQGRYRTLRELRPSPIGG